MKKRYYLFIQNRFAGYLLLILPFVMAVIFMALHKSPFVVPELLKNILNAFFALWLIFAYFYFGIRIIINAEEDGAWFWMKKLFCFHGNVVLYIILFGLICCLFIDPLLNYLMN